MKRIFSFGIIAILCAFLTASIGYAQDEVPSDSPPTPSYSLQETIVPDHSEAIDQILIQDSIEASKLTMVPYRSSIIRTAREYYLPPSLLAAFCDVESRFNPWAVRTEPHYKRNAVVKQGARATSRKHGGIPTYDTELDERSQSFGLMQTMGQLAREQGFEGKYLSQLFNPDSSLKQGAIKLKALLKRYRGDSLSMISAYNQGNNRKVNGIFENSRYVYLLNITWKGYRKLFNDRKLLAGAPIDTTVPAYSFDGGDNDWFWDQVRSSTAEATRIAIAERQKQLEDSLLREAEARYSDSVRYAQALLSDPGDGYPPSDVSAITVLAPNAESSERSVASYLVAGLLATIAVGVCLFGLYNLIQRHAGNGSGHGTGVPRDRSANAQGSFPSGVTASSAPVRAGSSLHG